MGAIDILKTVIQLRHSADKELKRVFQIERFTE